MDIDDTVLIYVNKLVTLPAGPRGIQQAQQVLLSLSEIFRREATDNPCFSDLAGCAHQEGYCLDL